MSDTSASSSLTFGPVWAKLVGPAGTLRVNLSMVTHIFDDGDHLSIHTRAGQVVTITDSTSQAALKTMVDSQAQAAPDGTIGSPVVTS